MTAETSSMTTNANKKTRCRAALLTHCVLLSTAFAWRADAAEPASGEQAIRELTQPTSELEVGVGDVTQGSYKFGEYNGLQREGAFPILNFDLSGGGLYNSDSLERWSARGADLGIDTRQLDVDYAQQGKFRIDLGYDQLRHNISDTYQTPYIGAGTDLLLLPSGWLKPNVPQVNPNNLNDRGLSPITGLASAVTRTGQVAPPDATQRAAVNAIINADVPAFRNYNLYTNRYRWNAGMAVNLSRHWQFTAGVRHERRDGTQPLGAVSSGVQENSVILPEPIDTVTEQYDAGLRYASSRATFDIGYYGSIFHNNLKSITWSDPPDATQTPSMSSAPSNQFHQLNIAGGYSFTPGTRLTVAGSYGRSTQDEAFLSDASLPLGPPASSADALIIITALGLAPSKLSSNVNISENRPHSRRPNQADLPPHYALASRHHVALRSRWQ